MSDINKRNTSEELARNVAEASTLLETHKERKVSQLYYIAWILLLLYRKKWKVERKYFRKYTKQERLEEAINSHLNPASSLLLFVETH